jgi:protein O-mannosyl-transferase
VFQRLARPANGGATPWLHAAALLALTLAAWHRVLRGTFQFDDFSAVLAAPAGGRCRIRPLLAWIWQWDLAVHGENASRFLAENLALHCLTVLVVYLLARRLLSPLGGFLAATTFALQPAHAEVVAYVSGRSTGLMSLLLLAALLAWATASDWRSAAARGWATGLALLLFISAALVKEVALVFPLLLLLWGTVGERRPGLGRRLAPFAAVALALAIGLSAIPRYRTLAAWSLEERSPLQALAVNASALPFQLSLWVRPDALSIEHALDSSVVPLTLALVILGALTAAAWLCRRRAPLVTLALVWVAAALLPTQSLVAKADVVTEKPLYLAWVGVAFLVGGTLAGAFERRERSPWSQPVLVAAVIVLAVVAASEVDERVAMWNDPVALWADATRKAPRSSRAWNNLGNALRMEDPQRALLAVRHSLALDPSNHRALANLINLEALCPSGCAVR